MFQMTVVILHGVEDLIWIVDVWYVHQVLVMHVQ